MADQETLPPFPGVEKFYDYRGVVGVSEHAPPLWLPIHQGDVFAGLDIPGAPDLPDGQYPQVMLFMHPCVMRRGAIIEDYVTSFRVVHESKKVVDYSRYATHYSVMPLPDLAGTGAGMHHAQLKMVGMVRGEDLDRSKRVASLSRDGRLLVQQRVVHHMTRHAPPLGDFGERTLAVEQELDLQASWVEAATEHSGLEIDTVLTAERDFDAFLSADGRRFGRYPTGVRTVSFRSLVASRRRCSDYDHQHDLPLSKRA